MRNEERKCSKDEKIIWSRKGPEGLNWFRWTGPIDVCVNLWIHFSWLVIELTWHRRRRSRRRRRIPSRSCCAPPHDRWSPCCPSSFRPPDVLRCYVVLVHALYEKLTNAKRLWKSPEHLRCCRGHFHRWRRGSTDGHAALTLISALVKFVKCVRFCNLEKHARQTSIS